MKTSIKVALIAGGYVAAYLVASAALTLRMATTSGPDAQASGGMYAFGDSVVFFAVFGLLALVPTGGVLYVLRPYRRFWMVLSLVCLAVAVTGPGAAILFAVGRHAPPSALATWVALSGLRILGAPLLALTFLVCALFSPDRPPRLVFLAATVMEAVVTACMCAVWFVVVFLNRH